MLTFDDVTVRYASGATAALTGLDLTIGPGEVVALVGPSGAGKSTVLRLAAGLVLPTSGTVEVLGVDSRVLGDRSRRSTRARVGSIHQDFALVGPLRVAHNVAAGRLGTWSTGRALRSLIRPVDLDGVDAALDRVGIADKSSERADRLSGGQQQRTAIARVLYQQPDLFLADEPCSALDPARAGDVLTELTGEVRRQDGRALVMSLHDADLAVAYADRVVGLRDGVVTFDLSAAEVTAERLTELYLLPESEGSLARAVQE